MKVGIISFCHSRNNYGQILQCWALQQALRKLDHEPYHIRYDLASQRPGKFRQFMDDGLFKSVLHRITHHREITLNKRFRALNEAYDPRRDFDGFMQRYLAMTPDVYRSMAELKAAPPQADAYLTGSDQVWAKHPDKEANLAFYLAFGPADVLRLSYAASFGSSSYPYRLIPALKRLLSRFDKVSVRENSGVSICSRAGIDSSVTLDPTLLLDDEDYNALDVPDNMHCPYLLVYSINIEQPEEMDWNGIKRYASSLGMEVRSVSATGHLPARDIFEGSICTYPTIPQWIGLIRGASAMFTTSFHGVVFSILTHTDFVFYPLSGRYSGGNARVTDLLSALDLEDRIWTSGMKYEELKKPDWAKVDAKLNELRRASFDFLKDNLKSR